MLISQLSPALVAAMFDLIVEGGYVLDGTGAPGVQTDVGIIEDRISCVDDLSSCGRTTTIRAANRVVAPGFIDVHGHSDLPLLLDGSGTSKVLQGVTTEIVGNCGMSAAPYVPDAWILGFNSKRVSTAGGTGWTDMNSYLKRLAERRLAYNVGVLVGFGSALRAGARDRAAAPLEHLRALLWDALAAGAFGISLGLYYRPDADAPPEFISACAEIAAREDRILTTHLRDESDFTIGLEASVKEGLQLARVHGVRLQISHLKAIGPGGWHQLPDAIQAITRAQEEGLDVGADQYPYDSTETALAKAVGLSSHIPPQDIDAVIDGHIASRGGPKRLVLSYCGTFPQFVGQSLHRIAKGLDEPVAHTVRRLCEDGEAGVISHAMRAEDLAQVMRQPWVAVASDGLGLTPQLASQVGDSHARSFGTFPRILGRYVREEGILELPDAIRRMTDLPATQFQIADRGRLRAGNFADIVVFDPRQVADTEGAGASQKDPVGVDVVIVNGRVAVRAGQQTDERTGKVLTR